jgi:1-deoxy-D-xylulose-5-phosphate synthase
VFDVGMAEQHGVGYGGALAIEGFHPVIAIYSTFLQRAYDQIVHDIVGMNIPVTFAMDRAGIVGEDGATHQGLFDVAFMRTLPNMVVMAPKDENELRHMLKTSVYHPGPSCLRYPRGSGLGVDMDEEISEIEIGKGEVIKDGKDLAIIAFGSMVDPSMKTATMLEEKGLSVAVINARFAKPIDKDLVTKYAKKTGCIVTTEEHSVQGGFGSAVVTIQPVFFAYFVTRSLSIGLAKRALITATLSPFSSSIVAVFIDGSTIEPKAIIARSFPSFITSPLPISISLISSSMSTPRPLPLGYRKQEGPG